MGREHWLHCGCEVSSEKLGSTSSALLNQGRMCAPDFCRSPKQELSLLHADYHLFTLPEIRLAGRDKPDATALS